MKQSAIKRILIWTAVMVLMLTALVMGVSGGFSDAGFSNGFQTTYTYDDAHEYTAGDAQVPAAGLQQIEIHWISGNVFIEEGSGDAIEFSEETTRQLEAHETMHYRVRNGKLTIQYCQAAHGLRWQNMPDKTLTVCVPAGTEVKVLGLELVSSNAAVDASMLSLKTLDVESTSGNVLIEDASAEELTIESVSGDSTISGQIGLVDAETVNGKLSLRLGDALREIDVENVNGDVDIALVSSIGFTATMDAVSGRLYSEMSEVSGRYFTQYGDGRVRMEFESVSGDVRLTHDDGLKENGAADAEPTAVEAEATAPGGAGASSQRKY